MSACGQWPDVQHTCVSFVAILWLCYDDDDADDDDDDFSVAVRPAAYP